MLAAAAHGGIYHVAQVVHLRGAEDTFLLVEDKAVLLQPLEHAAKIFLVLHMVSAGHQSVINLDEDVGNSFQHLVQEKLG